MWRVAEPSVEGPELASQDEAHEIHNVWAEENVALLVFVMSVEGKMLLYHCRVL